MSILVRALQRSRNIRKYIWREGRGGMVCDGKEREGEREIYVKELNHSIMGAGKSEICRVKLSGWRLWEEGMLHS